MLKPLHRRPRGPGAADPGMRVLFWFRADLRLDDNTGLRQAAHGRQWFALQENHVGRRDRLKPIGRVRQIGQLTNAKFHIGQAHIVRQQIGLVHRHPANHPLAEFQVVSLGKQFGKGPGGRAGGIQRWARPERRASVSGEANRGKMT